MSTPSLVSNPGPKKLARDAKILIGVGARIIPIGYNKVPLWRWRKYRTTAPTEQDIKDWCVDPRTAGWAVLTGPVSGGSTGGWLTIDVETAGMIYPQIIDPLKTLPRTSLRRTQHGGAHAHVLVYDAPDDWDWGGHPIARVKSKTSGTPVLLVEYRGDGQYAVLTGPGRPDLPEDFSPHPISVETFEQLVAGGRALHDPSTSQRKSLSKASAALAAGAAAGVNKKHVTGDTGWVLRQAVLEQPDIWPLLLDPGWTVLGTYPNYAQNKNGDWETRITLQRPGKDPKNEGESGNALGPVLQVFSTSVSWWPENCEGLGAIQAVAHAWFDGDHLATCTAIEATAANLVLNGTAPDPASAFAAWPLELLEEVHAARVKSTEVWQHQQATGGMGAPAVEGFLPEGAEAPTEATASVTDLNEHTVRTAAAKAAADAAKIDAEAESMFRKMLVTERARELFDEHKGAETDAKIREAEARGENPLGWLNFGDADFWSGTADWTFLLPDFWPVGASGAIYSGPGAGKSLIGLEWSACLATGSDVMGKPVDRRRVLYLDYENDSVLIRQRLEAMGFGPGDDLSWLTYSMLGEWPAFTTAAGGARLLAEALKLDVALVVIDTTARVIGDKKENDSDTFHALYDHTLVPLKRAGIAVLRFDHTGKEAEKGERGSSAKRGDVDLSYELTCDDVGQYVTLTRRKNRPHLPGDPELVLERVPAPKLRHLPVKPGTVVIGGGVAGPNPAVEAVVDYVRANPGCSANSIEEGLVAAGRKFSKAKITDARNIAETLGRIRVEAGANKRKLHFPGNPDEDITQWMQNVGTDASEGDGEAEE